ncbi:helix-turn-helix domain-containing protein [Ktedonosporobacter rubrisoli]|uniref:helix-turn-helix domain-containing protein n=1 Tax=Ktedonosporobacter rubrisoli TaxID=2509675 RepID=UPI001F5C3A21|nr:helix-turn-helix domain-containing protein [Ktedonosporobacter rubrisoli]
MVHYSKTASVLDERDTGPKLDDELLTVREVARHLRVDDTTVRRWIKTGALEAVTLPHRGKRRGYRVRKMTLDTLLNSPVLPA